MSAVYALRRHFFVSAIKKCLPAFRMYAAAAMMVAVVAVAVVALIVEIGFVAM